MSRETTLTRTMYAFTHSHTREKANQRRAQSDTTTKMWHPRRPLNCLPSCTYHHMKYVYLEEAENVMVTEQPTSTTPLEKKKKLQCLMANMIFLRTDTRSLFLFVFLFPFSGKKNRFFLFIPFRTDRSQSRFGHKLLGTRGGYAYS